MPRIPRVWGVRGFPLTSALTLQDINTTPKGLKTERDCSHRQLFRPRWGKTLTGLSLWCK